MKTKPTTGVSHLIARRIELIKNDHASIVGLDPHPSGRWGLILAEDEQGKRKTLVGAPGIVQAYLQAEVLPDLESMEPGSFLQSFPFVTEGWPIDWMRGIGVKPPGGDPGRVAVAVRAKRCARSWHRGRDRFSVTVEVRIQNTGAADDQTGLMTHHEVCRRELASFMKGVNSVAGMWLKRPLGN